jgi:hypothetical protein
MNRGEEEYNKAVKALFNTDDGMKVLAVWRDLYVFSSSIGDTPHDTYYNIALKEFVISLCREVQDADLNRVEERLRIITTEENYDD